MSYSVKALAHLSGVSVRTLHYYEERGLLAPARRANGYRAYDDACVARLQQILLYREAGMPLSEIARVLDSPDFDACGALREHLARLEGRIRQMNAMASSVRRTLRCLEEGVPMEDAARFEGFKAAMIEENERAYGAEVRSAWGDDAMDAANAKVAAMSAGDWAQAGELEGQVIEGLKEAMAEGDPAGQAARRLCETHAAWLKRFWGDGAYSVEAHRSLGQMYVADERFRAYYDERAGVGAAEFLRDALAAWDAR